MKTWRENEPLTEADLRLLRPLADAYALLGRSPKVSEIQTSSEIKARFRTWKLALCAAKLPPMNDPAQTRLREKR